MEVWINHDSLPSSQLICLNSDINNYYTNIPLKFPDIHNGILCCGWKAAYECADSGKYSHNLKAQARHPVASQWS